MNKYVGTTTFVAVLLSMFGCASAPRNGMTVCYTPFKAETFSALTPSSIFEYTDSCRTIASDSALAEQMRTYISDTSNPEDFQKDFDFMKVRLGIIDHLNGDRPVYVDQNGVVLIRAKMYQLPAATLADLEKLLDKNFPK